jgi:hypothetical protein
MDDLESSQKSGVAIDDAMPSQKSLVSLLSEAEDSLDVMLMRAIERGMHFASSQA